MTDPRRVIPSVDSLLEAEDFRPLLAGGGRQEVIAAVRSVQDRLRRTLAGDSSRDIAPDQLRDPAWFAARVAEELERRGQRSLRGVINATGVVLHTNLGRAPLAPAALDAMAEVAGYSTLEYDLDVGARGSRYDHCVPLLRELTGAEDALVVNNNAAALVLALNTLAEGRTAVVSRGELVEIGGSFRVPEIIARSGARMREVGATNRTHIEDYRAALEEGSAEEGPAVLLKVHRSNFRVEGYTAAVATSELAALAESAKLPLVHDLGSGALLDMTRFGLPREPTAGEALNEGADVVTMSGDKLLGGPQAGILLGTADLIGRLRANPLARALRPDKLTLAALEATLALYRDPDRAVRDVPVLRMLGLERNQLRDRAEALAAELRAGGMAAEVVPGIDRVGGGAYPGVELGGAAVALAGPAEPLARALRQGTPAVVGRIHEDHVQLHVRTVPEDREAALVEAILSAMREMNGTDEEAGAGEVADG